MSTGTDSIISKVVASDSISAARPVPSKPEPKVSVDQIYRMRFKSKGVISEKLFRFTGTHEEATQRAARHCELQGMRHIWTQPLLNDIDAEDKHVLKGS